MLDDFLKLSRQATLRAVQDDPTAEWLASRLAKGKRINVMVHSDHADRLREVFRTEPLVTVQAYDHLPDELAYFLEAPPTLEELLREPIDWGPPPTPTGG